MASDQDILNELEMDVEAQGGARLPDTHVPLKQIISSVEGRKNGGKDQKVETAGCSQTTMFVIPYERDAKGTNLVEEGMVTLCAYCDQLPLMARFSGGPL